MIRFTALPVLMVVCLTFPTHVQSALKDKGAALSNLPFEEGREPNQDDYNVFTKTFLVGMRNHHGDKNANALREFIDPRYLKKHGLTERDLSAEVLAVGNIHNYLVADDKQTILCLVETEENPRQAVNETILLRVAVHEGKLYLSPVKAPDPTTGAFKLWILRTKEGGKENNPPKIALPVGKWNVEFTNGVAEVCEIRKDGMASVEEPLRASPGTAVANATSLVITFDDDRTERWTPVGKRFIVEHWFPGSGFPTATPVFGIAESAP
jgi:hypothetical protein